MPPFVSVYACGLQNLPAGGPLKIVSLASHRRHNAKSGATATRTARNESGRRGVAVGPIRVQF